MSVIDITEYESAVLDLSDAHARTLQTEFGERLTVKPAGTGQWEITARQFVGTLRAGDLTVHIKPKVKLRNLLALMDIEVSSELWRSEVVSLEHDPDLLSVMSRLFCVAMEDMTRRGVRRSYVEMQDRLLSPRGRIDLATLMRHPGLDSPMPCRFDEHTADTRINQLLKAALEAARRVRGVGPIWQRRLLHQLNAFEDVAAVKGPFGWVDRWRPAPMELHYETAVRLAVIVLGSSALSDRLGGVASNSFLLNMNQLFEAWVGRRLQEMSTLEIREQWGTSLGADGEIAMTPDLTVWTNGRVTGVADCKYKLLKDGAGRSSDYYQALAYATTLRLPDCWLIYARWPGDTDAASVAVRNSGVTVRTFGVDLTGSIENAVEQVREFAERFVGAENLRGHAKQAVAAGGRQ